MNMQMALRGPPTTAGALSARERLTHHPDARRRLEAYLERLGDIRDHWLSVLNDVDGDCDLEEGGDLEPSLGSPQFGGAGDDRELDTADDEPSLGWTAGVSQLRLFTSANDDREDEHDGREPCCEDEGAQCDDEGFVEPEGLA